MSDISRWLLHGMVNLIPMVLSLTVHECAHAWAAYRLGDDTAARMGRLTLDPIVHIDPIGTILLPLLGVRTMMIAGAAIVASQLVAIGFGPPWPVQVANLILMGWGFYMLHGSLQVFASDLSATARATALALHSSFFFFGQAAGPIFYGALLAHVGKPSTLMLSAAIMIGLGLFTAAWLTQPRPR